MMSKTVERSDVQRMGAEDRARALYNVSISDKDHLKKWLLESGRPWVVFKSADLVEALPWPGGVESFMELVNYYRDFRRSISSGEVEWLEDPETGKMVEVPRMKTDSLEIDEMENLIRSLVTQITEMDPNWSLENLKA
jgi:hypothetical protein